MKVNDYMSKRVDVVFPDSSVQDVARLIFGRGINGVPVCEDKKLVGFITERDILAQFYPSIQEYVEDPLNATDFEAMEEKASEIFEKKALEIMSESLVTVNPNTPLLRAQSLMFIHKVGRLPVVNEDEELVGILSKSDIFRAVVGNKLELQQNEEYNDWLSKRYYGTVDWKNRLSLEMPDLVKVFRANKVKSIIDIGCESGEHTIALAKLGYTVVGVERSRAMTRRAKEKLAALSQPIAERIRFYGGELEDFIEKGTFKDQPFQAALFLGNTISHNPHNFEDVIKQTEKLLTGAKVMIFQITNFEKIFKTLNRLVSFNVVSADYAASQYAEHIFLQYYDPSRDGGKTILKTFAIFDFDGKQWEFYGLRSALFAYATKERVTKALHAAGYRDIQFYGSDFDGRKWDRLFRKPYRPLQSDWLNIIARKE